MLMNFRRKIRLFVFIGVVALIFAQGKIVFADEPVSVDVGHTYKSFWDQDFIQNSFIFWEGMWHAGIYNYNPAGSGLTVVSPKIVLESSLDFYSFFPNDPTVFAADPISGVYNWDFQGINIPPGMSQPVYAYQKGDDFEENARFTVKRNVTPEILTQDTVAQTITVEFRLDEPLPEGVDFVGITTGDIEWAYGHYLLVKHSVVSQNDVTGWNASVALGRPVWTANYKDVEIGKSYTFEAIVNQTKTEFLVGSPIYKPQVEVHYYHQVQFQGIFSGKEVTVNYPPYLNVSISNDVDINWRPFIQPMHYIFHLTQDISEITPPPPPFHVPIPADVRIKPETLNLKNKGVFTVFIRLPKQYSINDIDLTTVRAEGASVIRGVVANDTLIVKFRSQDLQNVKPGEEVELTVSGELKDGSIFKGTDTVRVIDKSI